MIPFPDLGAYRQRCSGNNWWKGWSVTDVEIGAPLLEKEADQGRVVFLLLVPDDENSSEK
jgi:hypothetical protein